MIKVERMIKLFDEEVILSKDIDKGMPWMTEGAYRRKQDSLKLKLKHNLEKQKELASKMTFDENWELYLRTEINLNEI
jgi:hypothetical protein